MDSNTPITAPASAASSNTSPGLLPKLVTTPPVPWKFGKDKCDCDDLKVQTTSDELGKKFADRMKSSDAQKGHTNVAVLLLSWEGTDLRNLDKELNRLESVFSDVYNYTVERAVIGKDIDNASFETIRLLANFIAKHNYSGSLVLVYYAGHGMNHQDDDFRIARTMGDDPAKSLERRKIRNTIVWSEIERVIFKTKPDLLIIFDCCQSGALALPRTRSVQPERIIEFVASCMPNDLARGPGDDSFTSALISALHALPVSRPEGFTIDELMQHVEESKYFKDYSQIPKVGYRGPYQAGERLRLKPLVSAANKAARVSSQTSGDRNEVVTQYRHVVRLNFDFSDAPSEENITELADDMADMLRRRQTPVMNISWGLVGERLEYIDLLDRWHKAVNTIVRRSRRSSVSPHLQVPAHSPNSMFHKAAGSWCSSGSNPGDISISPIAGASPRPGVRSLRQSWTLIAPAVALAFLAGCSFQWTSLAFTQC